MDQTTFQRFESAHRGHLSFLESSLAYDRDVEITAAERRYQEWRQTVRDCTAPWTEPFFSIAAQTPGHPYARMFDEQDVARERFGTAALAAWREMDARIARAFAS